MIDTKKCMYCKHCAQGVVCSRGLDGFFRLGRITYRCKITGKDKDALDTCKRWSAGKKLLNLT